MNHKLNWNKAFVVLILLLALPRGRFYQAENATTYQNYEGSPMQQPRKSTITEPDFQTPELMLELGAQE